ncbi:MAG: EAL domain-containing protein [Fibromonadaceae bacterium]|jgi:EAL and modified HD-GYP domain-containing signal transduction protein|nr:EAL domain-containing protein [Fibromonadaceae bacterium]
MSKEAFIARQPILDSKGSLVAYELLFRKRQGDTTSSIIDDMQATAQVLDNAINNIGVTNLVGNRKAFVNCSYDLLVSDILYLLDPKIFVLEVLEAVQIDEKIVGAVKDFHEKGYTIAIDDFVPSIEEFKRILPILPYTNIVKLEYPQIPLGDIEKTVKSLHQKGIKVLAEKIETEVDFNICRAADCDYYQGYFFAKPENLNSDKIDINSFGALQLLRSVYEHLEIEELNSEFKQQPELSVNLVKYLNSAQFALRTQVKSIRHAISLLGYDNLKRWLLILAYANKQNDITEQSPLLNNAIHRGTFFEEVTKLMNLDKNVADKAYLMGLISHLDALYKVSMQTILEQLPLDSEINKALLDKEGTLGDLLALTEAVETDDINKVQLLLDRLVLSVEDLNSALTKAYEVSNNPP